MQTTLPFDSGLLSLAESTGESDQHHSSGSLHRVFENFHSLEGSNLAFRILDAHRIKIFHAFDKLSSLSNSRTRLLPHQIEATHTVVGALNPRFILADEVGLGKTIETGLIVKELMLRRGFKRVIVCVPAPLTMQWQREMKSKFNEDFAILNRSTWNSNARHKDKIITSIDFIKNPKYANILLRKDWDVAVFDEAHRLRRDYSKVTLAYSFAEKLCNKVPAVLLLSATPFRGKLEELFYLIRLVDPHLLGPHQNFLAEYVQNRSGVDLKEKISKVLIRRRKVEVGGFTKRFARTVRFELTTEERQFYDAMTEYVRLEYNLAMQSANRAVGFVMIVFQKLLDSSTYALLCALQKRKAALEQKLFGPMSSYNDLDFEEILESEEAEDLAGNPKSNHEKSIADIRQEIMTLGRLIKLGITIGKDKKLLKFVETVHRLKSEGHKKFLVFTQFRSTQNYLAEALSEFKVALFHGSLNLKQKEEAIENFKNDTEILICTEAGGEGRNLQFASILFNYDLPWSPLKIEQRIGRLHRFGQTKDVYVFNFATRDTVAERILEVLEEKIRLFEESIGPSDALLGALEDELDFEAGLMSFISGKKTKAEWNQELDSKLKIAESAYTKLGELASPLYVDFNLSDYYDHTKKQREINNAEIERITLSYLEDNDDTQYHLKRKSSKFYDLLDRKSQKTIPATFLSEVALEDERAEFLAVGHALVESALNYYLEHPWRKSMCTMNTPAEAEKGHYFVFICRYSGSLNKLDLIGCMATETGRLYCTPNILIPAGYSIQEGLLSSESFSTQDTSHLEELFQAVRENAQAQAMQRAHDWQGKLASIFKKEEYKVEISYSKRLRYLEEKRDRHKLKYKMDPRVENRSTLTRTENEIREAKEKLARSIHDIRKDAEMRPQLQLLQVFKFI